MERVTATQSEAGTVRVADLWEKFRIFHSRPKGLKDRLFRLERASFQDFWALRDVSFELQAGETLAVIGSNGSGKSTLLKCLARILPPDRGRVEVTGRVASLLELGAGFHGDLSGRENIYLNGSILGMSRRELEVLFDEIVEFAGVQKFIDTPVRNYSSGMFVRLGFAIAINVDPDILLIDEILAVGDASFQTKCFERMRDFKRAGKTMILVSHDLDAVSRICDRAMLLERGEVVSTGPVRTVVNNYRRMGASDQPSVGVESRSRWGTGQAEIMSADLLSADGVPVESVPSGDLCTFRLLVQFKEHVEEPVFGYILRADDGTEVFVSNTMWRGLKTGSYEAGAVAEVSFNQRMNLLPGRYVFTTAVAHRDGTQWYDWWDECLFFHVDGLNADHGLVNLETTVDFKTLSPEEAQQSS
jgi:ABC-2 type transport system ATP-binding protein